MGLFHKTLEDVQRAVKSRKYSDAQVILAKHLTVEHDLFSDLAGLARAIHIYQQHLVDLDQKITVVKTSRGSRTERSEIKEINRLITSAQAEVGTIQVLISKLRTEARVDLP